MDDGDSIHALQTASGMRPNRIRYPKTKQPAQKPSPASSVAKKIIVKRTPFVAGAQPVERYITRAVTERISPIA
jgi:hypothetical protein